LFLGLARAAIVVRGGQPLVLRADTEDTAADAFAELP
jgi:hypothetical protein